MKVVTLRGLTWQHRRGYTPLTASAKAYQQLYPHVAIEWEQLPWERFRATAYQEMRTHSGRYDLYMFDHPWVGDFASNGWLVRLDELLRPEQEVDLADDTDPSSYRSYWYEGGLYALPVDASCHITFFRPDLVGTDTLPSDWDSLIELARRIHQPPKRYAFSQPWSATGGNATLSFIALLAAAGAHPFETRDELTVDPRLGRRCLEIMRQVWELSLPASALQGDHYRHLQEHDSVAIVVGRFAYINYFGAVGTHRLAAADVPVLPETRARASILGGMGLGISVDTPHRDVAWDYAWFVMSREVQGGIYIENDGQPGRLSALANPAIDRERDGFCTVLRKALAGCYVRPTYPRWLLIENGANPAIHRYLAGEYTADEVFRDFAKQANLVWKR